MTKWVFAKQGGVWLMTSMLSDGWLRDFTNRITKSRRKFNQLIFVNDPIMVNGNFTWPKMGERMADSRTNRFLLY